MASHVQMSNTSTQQVGGKTITTHRTVQDGVETVVVLENGVMVSKTVNGQPVVVQPVGYGGGGGSSVQMSNTSTQQVGGKTITTHRTVQDGVETVVVLENGVMVSKTVNGQPVAVQPVGYFQDMSKKKL